MQADRRYIVDLGLFRGLDSLPLNVTIATDGSCPFKSVHTHLIRTPLHARPSHFHTHTVEPFLDLHHIAVLRMRPFPTLLHPCCLPIMFRHFTHTHTCSCRMRGCARRSVDMFDVNGFHLHYRSSEWEGQGRLRRCVVQYVVWVLPPPALCWGRTVWRPASLCVSRG